MNSTKIPVILDTDIGLDIDDVWALGFLLKCPEFDVKLITTSSDNTPLKAKLVAKFLERVDRTDIPIGIGIPENNKKGWQYDWIKDYNISHYPGAVHENAAEMICSTILDSPTTVTLIAIGPLGTVAGALKLNHDIIKNSRFVGMHGSIRLGYRGSPYPPPHKEYNVKKNIKACRAVFQSAWDKTITPLDTCGDVILEGALLDRFLKTDNSTVNSIKDNFEIWKKNLIPKLFLVKKNRTSALFDTVAIYLGFSEDLLKIEELNIVVSDNGLTQINNSGNMIRCATSWKDLHAFKDLLVERLIN